MSNKISTLDYDMTRLRSDNAIVGTKQHRTDAGVGDVQFVILADGFMIDCGHDFHSGARAAALATIINAAPPEQRQLLDMWNRPRIPPAPPARPERG